MASNALRQEAHQAALRASISDGVAHGVTPADVAVHTCSRECDWKYVTRGGIKVFYCYVRNTLHVCTQDECNMKHQQDGKSVCSWTGNVHNSQVFRTEVCQGDSTMGVHSAVGATASGDVTPFAGIKPSESIDILREAAERSGRPSTPAPNKKRRVAADGAGLLAGVDIKAAAAAAMQRSRKRSRRGHRQGMKDSVVLMGKNTLVNNRRWTGSGGGKPKQKRHPTRPAPAPSDRSPTGDSRFFDRLAASLAGKSTIHYIRGAMERLDAVCGGDRRRSGRDGTMDFAHRVFFVAKRRTRGFPGSRDEMASLFRYHVDFIVNSEEARSIRGSQFAEFIGDVIRWWGVKTEACINQGRSVNIIELYIQTVARLRAISGHMASFDEFAPAEMVDHIVTRLTVIWPVLIDNLIARVQASATKKTSPLVLEKRPVATAATVPPVVSMADGGVGAGAGGVFGDSEDDDENDGDADAENELEVLIRGGRGNRTGEPTRANRERKRPTTAAEIRTYVIVFVYMLSQGEVVDKSGARVTEPGLKRFMVRKGVLDSLGMMGSRFGDTKYELQEAMKQCLFS